MILYVIVLFVSLCAAINLDTFISPFAPCTVHLIHPQLIGKEPTTVTVRSTPVTISHYYYSPYDYSALISPAPPTVNCDEEIYALHGNFTKFPLPTSRQQCDLVVYMAPKTCKAWYSPYPFSESVFFPKYRLLYPHLSASGDPNKTNYLLRSGRFFMLVGRKHQYLEDRGSSVFHGFDSSFGMDSQVTYATKYYLEASDDFQTVRYIYQSAVVYTEKYVTAITKICPSLSLWKRAFCFRLVLRKEGKIKFVRMETRKFMSLTFLTLEKDGTRVDVGRQCWIVACVSCINNATDDNTNLKAMLMHKHDDFLHMLYPNASIYPIRRRLDNSPFSILEFNDNSNKLQIIRLESPGYSFVSCSKSVKFDSLSIAGFTSAFGFKTWIFASFISILTIMFLRRYYNNSIWNSFIFPFNIFLEQEFSLEERTNRYFVLIWLLMGIILSNGYKGDNITMLTAPISKLKVQTFEDLLNQNFSMQSPLEKSFVKMNQEFWELYLDMSKYSGQNKTHETATEIIAKDNFTGETVFATTYSAYVANHSSLIYRIWNRVKKPKTLFEAIRSLNYNTTIEDLSNCSKLAYIDSHQKVFETFVYLQTRKDHSRDKEIVMPKPENRLPNTVSSWVFGKVRGTSATQFVIRVNSLFHSGIISMIDNLEVNLQMRKLTKELETNVVSETVKKLSLEDNVVVEFYVYMLCVTVDIAVFVFEILRSMQFFRIRPHVKSRVQGDSSISISVAGSECLLNSASTK